MELGSHIKARRAELGISQDELAGRIYVSRQTISSWENDKTYPDVQSLLLLSQVFGTTIDELVRGDVDTMKETIEKDVQLLRGVEVYVFADFRPWADEAHVSFEDVDELRQLVQFVLAYPVAGAGYSRVPAAYGYKSFLVRTDAHGAEFQQTEVLVVPSHSCLPVEYRTRRVEPDPYCDYQKKRAEQEKSQSACRYIEYPFHFFRLDRISVKLSMTYCTSSSLRWVCSGRVTSQRYWS